MKLNAGQQAALDAVLNGRNVYITGEGGTGKSVVVREAVRRLRRAGKEVAVCAPTGIAAQQIHGATIHSTFRFSFAPKVADALEDLSPSKVIKATDVIVIDEVGMVRRDLMDAIAHVVSLENERRESRPEEKKSDLQVVCVGDFSQLPPVVTPSDRAALEAGYGKGAGMHAFQASGWSALNLEPYMLTQVMRQRGDNAHIDMLNRARVGDKSCLSYFNALAHRNATIPADAVALVGTNKQAAAMNNERLRMLDGSPRKYVGETDGVFKDSDKPAPDTLVLKVGARILMVANDDEDHAWVNGSTGTVNTLDGTDDLGRPCITVNLDNGGVAKVHRKTWENVVYEVIEKDGKKRLAEHSLGQYTQYPMKLAYAVTYHKSQGQTLEKALLDPKTFVTGQLYVGLSRATSAAGIWLTREIRPKDLQADEEVVAYYRSLGWNPPAPATGDERPVLPAVTEDENDTPSVTSGTAEDAPLPTTMEAIMAELTRLLESGGRAWVRVYALMARVADEKLYKPSWRSYSAWLKALAAQTGVSEGLLWHRRSAGDFYESWRDNHPEAPDLSDGKTPGLTEENLNIVRKIDKVAPERTDELMTDIMSGETGTKALRAAWREVRQEASREREEHREQEGQEQGQDVPSPVVITDDASMTVTASDAATWTAVLDALRAAGLL